MEWEQWVGVVRPLGLSATREGRHERGITPCLLVSRSHRQVHRDENQRRASKVREA